jgi:hypothetical protein
MIKLVCVLIAIGALCGCGGHSTYDTAELRGREYGASGATIDVAGLTAEQIKAIAATRPPAALPIDIALMLAKESRIPGDMEELLLANVIANVKGTAAVKRVTPIPRLLMPTSFSFPAIQELGIRTLSEYVVILSVESDRLMKWTRILDTKFELTSRIDFMVVDSRTTAVVGTDRLSSVIVYEDDLFKAGEEKRAQNEIFAEQGVLLGEKLAALFQ